MYVNPTTNPSAYVRIPFFPEDLLPDSATRLGRSECNRNPHHHSHSYWCPPCGYMPRSCACVRVPVRSCAFPCAPERARAQLWALGVPACVCVRARVRSWRVRCGCAWFLVLPGACGWLPWLSWRLCKLAYGLCSCLGVPACWWWAHSGDMPAKPLGARRGGQIPPQARRTGAAAHTPAVCADGEGSPRRSHAPMGSGHQSMRLAFAPVTSPAGQRVRCGDHRTGVCAGK